MTNTPTTKVHFIGNEHITRAACGRMILSWRDDSLAYTTDPAAVTCKACTNAMVR